jgi:succinoglycan biosynthesis transport protein ExoP
MSVEKLPAVSHGNGNRHFPEVVRDMDPTPEFEPEEGRSGLNLHDILYMLFRHKWKIIVPTVIGLIAAVAMYFIFPPSYGSEAKLFVRYVVDKSGVDGFDPKVQTPDPQNDTVINSEVEILTSSDLMRQVAETVGVQRLVPGPVSNTTIEKAVEKIYKSLQVSVVKGTNIISVSYESSDPSLPMPIIQELVKRYFDKHLEVHRSAGTLDYVTKETVEIRKQLNDTEAELKQLKDKAGIISLTEAKATLTTELGKAQQEFDTASSDLASQRARLGDLEKSLAITSETKSDQPATPVNSDTMQKYQSLVTRVTQLQQQETELLSRYTAQSRIVRVKEAQIEGLDRQRQDLEKKYPSLVDSVPAAGTGEGQVNRPDLMTERALLAGLESKVAAVKSRISDLQDRAKLIAEVEPRIEELERKKEVEDASYKHSEASLEKTKIDDSIDESRIPNISIVQNPSAAVNEKRNVGKVVLGLAGGGLALGIAIALLIELVLDRTVKRSLELERRLRIPLLLSIPYLAPGSHPLRLEYAGGVSDRAEGEHGDDQLVPEDTGELLRPFCEAIRDRLGMFFEAHDMKHKPKLVAVAGLAKNAGASTLASGLADALSDTAEGRVLLVDKPVSPKRFYNMLGEFKQSDLDYVVFDMPSLGDTSATLPLAGFMDTVLLVVEAEKSNREAVKRAYAQLSAKTKVSVVFNKSRSYGPKWLEGEL